MFNTDDPEILELIGHIRQTLNITQSNFVNLSVHFEANEPVVVEMTFIPQRTDGIVGVKH
jgi:hypothetical protein